MYEVYDDELKNWNTLMEIARDYDFTVETILNYLIDWHGIQLLDRAFMENLINCEL